MVRSCRQVQTGASRVLINFMHQLITSESVTAGHPDKLADQISDSVVDYCIKADPYARVACECLLTKGLVVIAGEITAIADHLDMSEIARRVLVKNGYDSPEKGIDGNSCAVLVAVGKQSHDIAQGVDRKTGPQGAGDQGLMYGFACDETDQYMPVSIMAAHDITRRLEFLREDGADFLLPDGKSQVSVSYASEKPVIQSIVVSAQHTEDTDLSFLSNFIRQSVIKELNYDISEDCVYHINPTGRFVSGGPAADCGVTGRKIIVDTYGGVGRHGGGAFSGKDPSKVDRSGAYAARQLAKSLVYGNVCQKAEVQIAYAIGVAEPVSVYVDTKGGLGGGDYDSDLSQSIARNLDLTPGGIITRLNLIDFARTVGFRTTATYGHFTSNLFPWEASDGLTNVLDQII